MKRFGQGVLLVAFIISLIAVAAPQAELAAGVAALIMLVFAISIMYDDHDWRDGYSEGYIDATNEVVDLGWLSDDSNRQTAYTVDALRAMKHMSRNGWKSQ